MLLIAACSAAPSNVVSVPTLAVLPSASPTHIVMPTLTDTLNPTDTATPSPTNVNTLTPADTLTPTDTFTPSATYTPSLTFTPSNTSRPTIELVTITSSPTPTPTNTLAPTPIPSPAVKGNATVAMASDHRLVELLDGPGFTYGEIQPLSTGTGMYLIGRSWDNQWYQVRLGSGQTGWIYNLNLVLWISPDQVPVTWSQPTAVPTSPPPALFALGGHVMDTSSAGFGLARSAGMTWIKLQYRYYVGQNTGEIAADIQTVHQNGFRILLSIVGDKAQMGNYSAYIASYADFVSRAAALGADAIEIWNEPNIDREWPDGMIQGGTYTQMLAAAYTAIKGRSPNTIVISAAPAPTGFFGGSGCDTSGCNDDVFFRQMAYAGAQNYLDCVGLHHNDGIVSPMQASGDPRGNYPTNYFTGVMSRVPAQFNGKPLCFTEIGYLSPQGYGGLPGNFAWAQNTTVADQAQWLAQAVELARSSRRVEMMIVWNLDFTSYTSSDPMAGYAILRPGGSCPACNALKSLMGQ